MTTTVDRAPAAYFSIDAFVEEEKVSRFAIWLWILCFLALLADGFDLTVIAFVAPELVRELGVAKSALGMVFSASLVGMAVGAPLFGWFGDRHGRKSAIVAGSLLLGGATLALLLARTAEQVALLRLFAGFGLGGVVPNVIALSAEFAPKRVRSRVLVLVGTGVPLGAVIPGVLTATLVPGAGWHLLIWVGALLPLGVAVACLLWMPESIKFLGLRQERRADLQRLLTKLQPRFELPHGQQLLLAGGGQARMKKASPSMLFSDGLGWITLLLWVVFFTNLMVNFFVNNWMPIVFQDAGMSAQQAGFTSALYAVGALLASLGLAAWMGRSGAALIAVMFVVAVPVIASIGGVGGNSTLLGMLVFLAGVCVGGIQTGVNSIAGLIYPTSVRATGAAWALAVGRLGSILGPLIGAAVVARKLPVQQLFQVPAVPMAVGAVAAIALTVLCHRRFAGFQLDEAATVSPPALSPRPSGGAMAAE